MVQSRCITLGRGNSGLRGFLRVVARGDGSRSSLRQIEAAGQGGQSSATKRHLGSAAAAGGRIAKTNQPSQNTLQKIPLCQKSFAAETDFRCSRPETSRSPPPPLPLDHRNGSDPGAGRTEIETEDAPSGALQQAVRGHNTSAPRVPGLLAGELPTARPRPLPDRTEGNSEA
jgi:hypothetical protein